MDIIEEKIKELLAEAKTLLKNKQVSETVEKIKQVLQLDPENEEAKYVLDKLNIATGIQIAPTRKLLIISNEQETISNIKVLFNGIEIGQLKNGYFEFPLKNDGIVELKSEYLSINISAHKNQSSVVIVKIDKEKDQLLFDQFDVNNLESLLELSKKFILQHKYHIASGILEQIIIFDSSNSQCYFQRLLIELEIDTLNQLNESQVLLDDNENYNKALRYANNQQRLELLSYANKARENLYNNAISDVENRRYEDALSKFKTIKKYKDSETQIENLEKKIKDLRNAEEKYLSGIISQPNPRIEQIESSIQILQQLGDYKDSVSLVAEYKKLLQKTIEKETILAKKKEKLKKTVKISFFTGIPAILLIALLIFIVTIIVPANKYNNAMTMIDSGNYSEAKAILSDIEGFSDSENQIRIIDAYIAFESQDYEEGIALLQEIGIPVDVSYDLDGGYSTTLNFSLFVPLSMSDDTPNKDGYTFNGWDLIHYSINNAKGDYSAEVELKATYLLTQYTIAFDSNGGSPVTAITQDYATTVSKPTDPTKVGYTFAGWYSDSNLSTAYTFTTMPAEDITLYAKWNIITYSINYELADGLNHLSNPSSYTIETNTIILSAPTKEGYTFEGWYSDSNFTNYVSEITIGSIGNLTLYAKWNINSYNITYYIHPDDYDPLKDISLAPGETIIQVSLGGSHSAALTSSGRLFTWGRNEGQLGDGTTSNKSTPTEITSLFNLVTGDKIIQVSLGYEDSAALTSNGRLFTWRDNGVGQLGDGTTVRKSTPTEITSRISLATGDKIIQVSLGYYHSAALTSSGRLFTWGYNYYGQLGDGTYGRNNNRSTPTEITSQFILSTGDKIISVSLGDYHSAALTSSGRLFTWGYNVVGQLGNGTNARKYTPTEITSRISLATGDKIIQVSLSDHHSATLTSSGRIFTWGNNDLGQLGDGTSSNRYTPTEITSRISLATGDKIIQVSLGGNHSAALTSSGRLFTWGSNGSGRLGDGTTTNKSTPTEITSRFNLVTGDKIIQVSLGNFHSAALTSSGRLFTWGSNNNGQLGDGTTTNRSTPTEITQAHYELLHSDTVIYNQSITEYVPTREGYTFSGWYSDINLKTPYIFGSMPAEDITLHGKWVSND